MTPSPHAHEHLLSQIEDILLNISEARDVIEDVRSHEDAISELEIALGGIQSLIDDLRGGAR